MFGLKYTQEKFADDFADVVEYLEDLFGHVPKSNLGRGEWVSQYQSAISRGERLISLAKEHGINDPLPDQMIDLYAKRFVESFY